MPNVTIKETYTLPSKGLVYDPPINPEITLRSMTTMEEMVRLSPTVTPYKSMCSVIEDCIVVENGQKKPSVYDLCISDYQFLLHKLRIVTYGPEYKMIVECPKCGGVEEKLFNLEELSIDEYDDSIKDLYYVDLPMCGKTVKLKMQTPRMLDDIANKKRKMLEKDPLQLDPSFMLTLKSIVEEVDGIVLDDLKKERFLQGLLMKDANAILLAADKLNRKMGIDTVVFCECGKCGNHYVTTFRITPEFFGPTNA